MTLSIYNLISLMEQCIIYGLEVANNLWAFIWRSADGEATITGLWSMKKGHHSSYSIRSPEAFCCISSINPTLSTCLTLWKEDLSSWLLLLYKEVKEYETSLRALHCDGFVARSRTLQWDKWGLEWRPFALWSITMRSWMWTCHVKMKSSEVSINQMDLCPEKESY